MIPIIVHIDRYERKAAERLLEMKVMTQINAESLARRRERRYLKGLFDSEKAHVLGSDAHGEGTEFAAFSKAVKILGESTKTVMERAERILNNEKIR